MSTNCGDIRVIWHTITHIDAPENASLSNSALMVSKGFMFCYTIFIMLEPSSLFYVNIKTKVQRNTVRFRVSKTKQNP